MKPELYVVRGTKRTTFVFSGISDDFSVVFVSEATGEQLIIPPLSFTSMVEEMAKAENEPDSKPPCIHGTAYGLFCTDCYH